MKNLYKKIFDSDLSNDDLEQLFGLLNDSTSWNDKLISSLVGVGCRYPEGIKTPSQLYDFLKSGGVATGDAGLKHRFSSSTVDDLSPQAIGAFLKDVDLFDPLFFGISPKEAREIDPQHRLAMLTIWEALEDAGIAVDSLRGRSVGVFIASSSDDYQHLALTDERVDLVNVYTSLGTSRSSAAGRIAYLFGFNGPALQVDTSCSSSLVAVHLACQSLAAGECELAIVAGVNLILSEKNIQLRTQLNAMSAQGICRPFDESADGFVQGEGIGAIVLKPTHQARRDGNPIYFDILASACNHNGGGNGLTAPNGTAQEALLREALNTAGVSPQDVFYIEAHGTGTKLGDPIEIQSINNVYNAAGGEQSPLYVGSSKANFGHLEAGAGLLSLIKTAMMMEHGEIPPQVHLQQPNSLIDWQSGRATVATEARPWPADSQGRRIAGISSFGITGTNAHLIVAKTLDESQPCTEEIGSERWPLLLSARQPEGLPLLCQQLTHSATNTQASLADASYTLAVGRRHFEHRVAVAVSSWDEVAAALHTPPAPLHNKKGWVFACTGQGAQYLGMGQTWYQRFPVFRAAMDELDALYQASRGHSLLHILWQQPDEEALNDTAVAQPALYAFEYATCKLMQSFGIEPAAVIGHSVGEYVAACIAGVFTVSQAFNLVLLRAQLMSALPRDGSMMSVRAAPESLCEALADFADLEVCALNSPALTVVGGPHSQLSALQSRLEQQGITVFPLTVSNAFHTAAMEPAMAALTELASQIDMHMPTLPLVSNLTGSAIDLDEMSGDYWARHMRQTVRFWPGAEFLGQQGYTHFLEIGPRPVLSQLIRMSIPQSCTVACCAPGHEQASLVDALCQVFSAGGEVRWSALFPAPSGRRVVLPHYPFQLTRCWLESADTSTIGSKSEAMKGHTETVLSDIAPILAELQSIFSDLLHIPAASMDIQRSLLESGVDSFVIVMAVNRIKEQYGIKITVRDIFERYISISKLAEHLHVQGASANMAAASVAAPSATVAAPQTEAAPAAAPHYANSYNTAPAATASAATATHGSYAPPVFALEEPAAVAAPQPVASVAECSTLTSAQQRYLSEFIQRYNAKTSRSKQQAAASRSYLCNNRKSSSGFRQETKELTYSIQCHASSGSRITDIDGNEYVDLAMGFGATLFGHRPDFVVQRLQQQLDQGYQIGPESHLAGECARMITETTGMDRVLFANSGTEAVMTALRIARAASGRRKVVMFQNAYHGHFDGTMSVPDHEAGAGVSRPMAPGTPQSMVDDVIVLPFNSPQATDYLRRHAQQIAVVLTEPVQNRDPGLHPQQFLLDVRQITKDNGIILIFDEVLVGYRIALGGAQQWFGIEADMSTYGKVIGGGLPIGVIAGKRAIMDKVDGGQWQFNDNSAPKPQTTYTAGTFCKHPLAIAACHAVLTRMIEEGPGLQERLNHRTSELVRILNEVFRAHQVPLQVVNFGSFFRIAQNGNLSFVYQPLELDIFFFHLVEKNVYVWEGKTCFLSTAHTNTDIQQIINAVNDSVVEMKAAGFWADSLPSDGTQLNDHQPAQPAGVTPPKKPDPASVLSRAMSQARDKSAPQEEKAHNYRYPDSITDGSFLASRSAEAEMDFGLYFFGDETEDKFSQILNTARYADQAGFHSFWLPERHFNPFGGFAPKPAVIAAALANATQRLQIRASVLAPLHHPVSLAEEWAVVDNLSAGRIGVAMASGWFVNDFVLNPDAWGIQRDVMLDNMNAVQHLWKGNALSVNGVEGKPVDVVLHPRPIQAGLPLWLTTLGNTQNYIDAGHKGIGILTNMIGQKVSDLAANILLYREARAEAGFDPQGGHITVLLHTLIMEDAEQAIETAREPFCHYLNSSVALFQKMVAQEGLEANFDSLGDEDRMFLLNAAYQRYIKGNALIGNVDQCAEIVENLRDIGVTEIACFVDFGVSTEVMEASFAHITRLKNRFRHAASAELNYTSLAPIVSGESKLIQPEAASRHSLQATQSRQPLTDDQRMLWFIGRRNPGGMMAFAQTSVLKLTGPLKVAALQKAYQAVVVRHDALRTRIDQDGQYQAVVSEAQAHLHRVDLTWLDAGNQDAPIRELLAAESQKPFLFDDLLHRLTLVALSDQQHLLLLTTHHLSCDGVSIGVLLTELAAAYDAFCQPRMPSFAPVLQFSEYVQWRNKQYLEADFQREESYWLEQCADRELEPLSLPTDYARPVVKTYNGDRVVMALDKTSFEQLKNFALESQMTWFMVVLGAFYCLLYRLARQQKIVVGVPFSGRTLNNSEAMVGYLSNVYPIAMEMRADESIADYLQRLRMTLLDAYEHQNYPFSLLVEKASYRRDASSSPLFNVAFNWDRVDFPPMYDIEVSAYPWKPRHVEYDLMINLLEVNDEAELSWDFNTDLFDSATIQHLSQQFVCLLRQFISGGRGLAYSRMPLEENAAQLSQRIPLPATETFVSVSQRLSDCARRWPNHLAVSDGERSLNWQKLDQYSTKLANRLLQRGVGKGESVALCLPPSVALLVAIHAVTRIGAVYVPLNTRYPAERLREIADNAGANTIIRAEERYSDIFPDTLKAVLVLDGALSCLNNASKKACAVAVTPQDGVYLIHTSGSTGTPKGVKTTYGNLISFCHAALERLQMSGAECFLNVSPAAFDMSVPDFFLPLFNGGQVILASEDDRLLPENLVALLEKHDVDFMQATPTTWQAVIEGGWQGKANLKACAGGEMLTRSLAKALSERAASVWNGYGPTETTVWSNLLQVTESHLHTAVIMVGQPLANAVVYVLDDHFQPVADGHMGEIYIGGHGVASGYLNQPALSATSFVINPWGSGQLYKTGDLGRWSSRGGVAVLGRCDTQVKIRGFRIETGEIEAALAELDDVAAAVVRVDQHNNALVLTGFVELSANATVSGSTLRSRLKMVLPDYMVPTVIQVMAELPRSGNDKIDRKQLPVVDFQSEEAEYVAPENEAEAALCKIVQGVLNVEKLSCEADFFESGGSSLDLVRLQQAIQAQFGVEIQITRLFTNTTAREMAALVLDPAARGVPAGVPPASPVQADTRAVILPVTPTLHYHLYHLGYRHHLNLIKLFDVQQADLTPARLHDAIGKLLQQHEALTLSVWQNAQQEWVQEVGVCQPVLEILDLSALPATAFVVEVEERLSQMQSQFSLQQGQPLARFVWVTPPQGEAARLMVALHFALTDAYGMELLADQLMTLLEGRELPPAGSRYRDWFSAYQRFAREQALTDLSFWHGLPWYRVGVLRQECRAPACEKDRFYHRDDYLQLMRVLSGQQPVSDRERAALEASQTLHSFTLGETRSARLKAALATVGVEQVDALLAAYYQLLQPLLSGRFLPVDFMFSNRKPLLRDINITETVMRAAENIVLPLDLDEADPLTQARQVQRIRTGLPHYGLGLPALRVLNPDQALRNQLNALPLPQVGFNYLSLWSLGSVSSDRPLTPSALQPGQNIGNQIDVERGIWLQLYIDESARGLEFTFSYDAHRFIYADVVALAEQFLEKLVTLCCIAENHSSESVQSLT